MIYQITWMDLITLADFEPEYVDNIDIQDLDPDDVNHGWSRWIWSEIYRAAREDYHDTRDITDEEDAQDMMTQHTWESMTLMSHGMWTTSNNTSMIGWEGLSYNYKEMIIITRSDEDESFDELIRTLYNKFKEDFED